MNDSYLNFLSMQLYAEISGMNAENNQRMVLGESMAYTDEDYHKVSIAYRELADEYLKKCQKKSK
jgi:hypothetical protein